jgi:hypothetical protein
MCKLGDQDFRSAENRAFLYRIGQCISLAAGANAPHGVLVHLRHRMTPALWSHIGFVWAEAAERPYWAASCLWSYKGFFPECYCLID